MKSQYINKFGININDIVRLNFGETTNGEDSFEVVSVCLQIDYAELVGKTILETIAKHRKNIEDQKAGIETDKELN